jgi:predicted cobalt transporter CbtA
MAKQTQPNSNAADKKPAPAPVRPAATKSESIFSAGKHDFIFGKRHFMVFGISLLLVLLGLVTMSGGAQPDPNQWDESLVYSPIRITLAPMLMLAGFGTAIYGIFMKSAE